MYLVLSMIEALYVRYFGACKTKFYKKKLHDVAAKFRFAAPDPRC
jgi:hypothetical protein